MSKNAIDEEARIAVEGHGAYEPGYEIEVPGLNTGATQ